MIEVRRTLTWESVDERGHRRLARLSPTSTNVRFSISQDGNVIDQGWLISPWPDEALPLAEYERVALDFVGGPDFEIAGAVNGRIDDTGNTPVAPDVAAAAMGVRH